MECHLVRSANHIKSNMCLFGCKQFNFINYTVKQYAQRLLTTRRQQKIVIKIEARRQKILHACCKSV